jgi:hypothetical protein
VILPLAYLLRTEPSQPWPFRAHLTA